MPAPDAADAGHGDRGDHAAERAARETMVRAARTCINRALSIPADNDVQRAFYASDEVFRRLHGCIWQYAIVLRALDIPLSQAMLMTREALAEAAQPDEAHPALVGAAQQWCEEAYRRGNQQGDD